MTPFKDRQASPYRASKRLSVTHVITGLNVGGAERALNSLLTGGLETHVSNRVISLMDEGHYGPLLRQAGIEVSCLGMKRGLATPIVLGRLFRALRAAPPDVVQGWMYHGNLAATMGACFVPGRPAAVWNVRTSLDDLSFFEGTTRLIVKLNARLSSSVRAIIYNSARSRRQHRLLGYADTRDIVIPNGFDLNLWRHGAEARKRARAELGIKRGVLAVGFVGRGVPVKDVPTLLRAFAQVRARVENSVLICVGRDIEAQCPAGVSTKGVTFLGQRNDVARLLPAFDLLCLSSRVEGFPNVIGEAMACAVPCITTDVGDAADVVGKSGWVVPPGDPVAYADALEAALREPPEVRAHRGAMARRRIEESYALPAIVAQYSDLYTKLRTPA